MHSSGISERGGQQDIKIKSLSRSSSELSRKQEEGPYEHRKSRGLQETQLYMGSSAKVPKSDLKLNLAGQGANG